ncbi:MAG TPA: hypothetical protein VEI96_06840, partial [Thermodesulfovibrionales bacterium]|nr:hypothetical protein [Thermodesulfovibrionales bacterium]
MGEGRYGPFSFFTILPGWDKLEKKESFFARDMYRTDRDTEIQHRDSLSILIRKPFFHLLLIAVVGLAAYSNCFSVPFVFDDDFNIVHNPVIRVLDHFFTSLKGYDFNPRRYIGYLSFALNYRIGGLDVAGYHGVNVAIHIGNAMLLYLLVLLTFRTPYFAHSSLEDGCCQPKDSGSAGPDAFPVPVFIAFFASLLFAAHPVQTQAVTYIVQRFTSLATLFYLLSLVFYIKGRLKSQGAKSPLLFYCLSLVLALCAMKTKEMAWTLPVIIILYEVLFFESPLRRRLLYLLPVLLTLLIIPVSIVNTDKSLGEVLSDLSEKTRVQSEISREDYFMTEMRVIVTYIRLIFFPVNQNLDYDYPVSYSFFTPPVFFSFLLLAAIFGAAVYLLYRSRKAEGKAYYRLIAFGILWFFTGLSIESSVIPIADVIFEHRLYLPAVGAFIAIATSLV